MTKCDICFTKVNPWDLWKLPLPGRTINACKKCSSATRQWMEAWEAANKAKAEQAASDVIEKARGKG